jgi:hypothetical protein
MPLCVLILLVKKKCTGEAKLLESSRDWFVTIIVNTIAQKHQNRIGPRCLITLGVDSTTGCIIKYVDCLIKSHMGD